MEISSKSKPTWTIVCFEEENTVEAVPTSWIVGDMCHFPITTNEKVMASIAKNEIVNIDWPRHKVKTFRNGTYDDYLLARRKCKVAEDTSELSSLSEYEGIKKRKRIRKVLSSDSEEEIIGTRLPPPPKLTLRTTEKLPASPKLTLRTTLPAPPKRTLGTTRVLENSSVSRRTSFSEPESVDDTVCRTPSQIVSRRTSFSESVDDAVCRTPSQTVSRRTSFSEPETVDETICRPSSQTVSKGTTRNSHFFGLVPQPEIAKNTFCNTPRRSPLVTPNINKYDGEGSNYSRAQCNNLCNKCCNQFASLCCSKLGDISTQCHLIRSMVTDVLKLATTPKLIDDQEEVSFFIKSEIRFPLEEMDELNKFEVYLNVQSNFDSAVKELAKVGGDNSYDFMKRNMAPMFSNSLAEKFNWEGKKKKNKFKELKVAKLLIEADKKAKICRTIKDSEKAIIGYLKRAKERFERSQKAF